MSETRRRAHYLSGNRGGSKSRENQNADLARLLLELAFVLLPRGITPNRFASLAREAFIRAAAEQSRLRNRRVNYSKVAALTGLSRREIRRVLEFQDTSTSRNAISTVSAPSDRIVEGWLSDRQFVTDKGRPKLLPITGGLSSFQRLIKLYGGDISHRAILEELLRSKRVRTIGKSVELRASKLQNRTESRGSFGRLIPVLVDGLKIASSNAKNEPIDSLLHRMQLTANTETELSLIRARCLVAIAAFTRGLQESLSHELTIPVRKRIGRHNLNLTVLLATDRERH